MPRIAVPSVALVWALLGIVAVEIVVTYARLPANELYHVSESGLRGGLSRALVFLDFPVALAALPVIALAAERLRSSRVAVAAAIVGAVLCAVVAWPHVVDQADLDAKPVNALPALGVAIAFGLTLGAHLLGERARVNALSVVLAALLLVLALPWLAAELGFSLDGVPVLGSVFLTGERVGSLAAVHHGHHHGMDGVLLALTALALLPLARSMRAPTLRPATTVYLSLQLAYGLANAVQDAWSEQLVKRGTVHTEIPSVLHPEVTLAWLAVVLAAALFSLVALRRRGVVGQSTSDRTDGVEQSGLPRSERLRRLDGTWRGE